MKIREFNIENYDLKQRLRQMVCDTNKEIKIGGVSIKISINPYNVSIDEEVLSKIDKNTMDEMVEFFKNQYKEKSEKTVKEFDRYKKYSDKILFDDKDYSELLEVLKDNYYCQALEMLIQIVETKTKGKSARALKYQARKMQASNVSCD